MIEIYINQVKIMRLGKIICLREFCRLLFVDYLVISLGRCFKTNFNSFKIFIQ